MLPVQGAREVLDILRIMSLDISVSTSKTDWFELGNSLLCCESSVHSVACARNADIVGLGELVEGRSSHVPNHKQSSDIESGTWNDIRHMSR